MRLNKVVSKNAVQYYVIESTYIHGKHSTRIVEKLGTYEELSKIHADPDAWAKAYIDELNKKILKERQENKNNEDVILKLNAGTQIPKNTRQQFNGGYLFLQSIFYSLGLDKICDSIQQDSKAEYNLAEILSRLLYSRILDPGSKARTYDFSQKMIEPSSFEQHDLYRALSVLAENSDKIQAEVYKNSKKLGKRNDGIMYYDCTNYYFEIEQEDDFRKYGKSKAHKPNPIVGMGLFMDEDAIPLAFSMFPGNKNEQSTMSPLEEKIDKDFKHSKYVVCTDAGLSSKANRLFNSKDDKAFITTQSIKQLPDDLKNWALDPAGWKILGSSDDKTYNLEDLEKDENLDANGKSRFFNVHFYKERQYKDEIETGELDKKGKKKKEYLEERIIVTYSLKYRDYLRYIRKGQVERAMNLIQASTNKDGTLSKSKSKKRYGQTDFHRFIESTNVDMATGEILPEIMLTLKQDVIDNEEVYDGFYGIATDLDDSAEKIIGINKKRWQIETCFRIMKTDFDAEPVYLSREDRIKAHFLTCFLALIVYRYLERLISTDEKKYTIGEVTQELRDMNFLVSSGNGYIPTYKRTEFTDRLHQVFGFRTDYQIIPIKDMKKVIQKTKS